MPLLVATVFVTAALCGAEVAAADAEAVLNARCSACHERLPDGGLARISESRKTPEGWDMNIVRMMIAHGVKVTPDERRTLVKHLADTQGLAPAETRDYRYILERRPNAIESPPDDELAAMCGRCHSYARVALQRRDTDEWLKLSHFHLGQYPTTEYQALGRDRNWWDIASKDVPPKLGEMYPFETKAWSDWRAMQPRGAAGDWRVVGHRPGHGGYEGVLRIREAGDDAYTVALDAAYANGNKMSGKGSAIIYTGYEWRARLTLGGEIWLHVAALSEDGARMDGRAFLEDTDSLGANMTAVRIDGAAPAVLSVSPAYARAGDTHTVSIHGVGLGGDVSLGEGVEVLETVKSSDRTITVNIRAGGLSGARTVTAGGARADGLFTVYDKVASVRVEPGYAVARVGANGGPLPAVPAQFDAVAYHAGSDGEAGTDDDLRIGVMPAKWSVGNFNETAEAMDDARIAGVMDAGGLFRPAGAGLNPERRYSTNNVGDLSVNAVVSDGGTEVEGSGHLIVTVQRWNDPPIR